MAIVLLFSSKALASQQDIDVCVNGKYLSFENTKPFIQNERVLIPMRIIFEELGADVKWDGINKTIYATKDGLNIIMQIENDNMIVNDKNIKLDAAPVIFNDTTMVPVRAVADCFNAETQWSNLNRSVSITTNGISVYADSPDVPDIGKLFDLDLKYKNVQQDVVTYVYNYDEVLALGDEINLMDEYFAKFGYVQGQEPDTLETRYSKDATILYFNSNINKFIIRVIFSEINDNDFIVEVNNTAPVYNIDGVIQYITSQDKDAWEKLGWYTNINDVQQTLYSKDGESIVVYKSEVPEYLNAGWYEEVLNNSESIENYLTKKYSTCTTALGDTNFTFTVYKNDSVSFPYDYWILVEYDYLFFYKIADTISYTEAEKAQAKADLKWFQECIALDLINRFPDKKLTGEYYHGYYKYPSIRQGYTSTTCYTWSNYKENDPIDYGNRYYNSEIVGFQWLDENFILEF